MSALWERLNDLLPWPGAALAFGLLGIGGAAVLTILWRRLRRRRDAAAPLPPDLRVDVTTLGNYGPPEGPPTLDFYNLPVRVAAIVLAPVGRHRELPADQELGPLLDAILPGLDRVVALHQPMLRRWPNQVSARGFSHRFFSNARLPGPGGKGTPWSSVAGVFKHDGRPVMAGLVLRAASPNGFGQTLVDSEEKWLGCLRVR